MNKFISIINKIFNKMKNVMGAQNTHNTFISLYDTDKNIILSHVKDRNWYKTTFYKYYNGTLLYTITLEYNRKPILYYYVYNGSRICKFNRYIESTNDLIYLLSN